MCVHGNQMLCGADHEGVTVQSRLLCRMGQLEDPLQGRVDQPGREIARDRPPAPQVDGDDRGIAESGDVGWNNPAKSRIGQQPGQRIWGKRGDRLRRFNPLILLCHHSADPVALTEQVFGGAERANLASLLPDELFRRAGKDLAQQPGRQSQAAGGGTAEEGFLQHLVEQEGAGLAQRGVEGGQGERFPKELFQQRRLPGLIQPLPYSEGL